MRQQLLLVKLLSNLWRACGLEGRFAMWSVSLLYLCPQLNLFFFFFFIFFKCRRHAGVQVPTLKSRVISCSPAGAAVHRDLAACRSSTSCLPAGCCLWGAELML